MSTRMMAAVATVAAATVAAGCGDDSSSGPAASTPAVEKQPADTPTRTSNGPSTGRTTHLKLRADPDGLARFDKKTLRAPAGKIIITLSPRNSAQESHNIGIKGNGVFVASPSIIVGHISVSSTLKPGTYTFFCSVRAHERFGMHGTLRVTT